MIPEISFPKNINLESIDLRFLKKLLNTHPQYKHFKWDHKSTAHFIGKPVDPATKRQTDRRRCFEKLLGKLAASDIPAKDHIEEYLRDQYRRNCSVNTLRNSLFVIDSFLTFVKSLRKNSLKVITRKDLLSFIEHEQDRGMKPNSVDARVRTLKTFLRFLIERDCLSPEVLSKRIFIKVPGALPRAMAPEDVRKLLGLIDTVRDRAMILVLLRTGMRIGELLNTLLREVNIVRDLGDARSWGRLLDYWFN